MKSEMSALKWELIYYYITVPVNSWNNYEFDESFF